MEVYAEVTDLETRYKTLTDEEKQRASALLEHASSYIYFELKKAGKPYRMGELDVDTRVLVRNVVCSMAKRAMMSPNSDISSESMGVGGYTQSLTYANPAGDIYLKDSERRILGIPLHKMRIGSFAPKVHGE